MQSGSSTAQGAIPLSRRESLVLAAFQCISEKGLEGLRLRDVAVGAGIDHSTLHHYFATKQALVSAVVDYSTRQFWATMPADGTTTERLAYHLRALSALIVERPALFTVLAELDLRARRDPEVRAVLGQHEAGWRAALRAVLSDVGVAQHDNHLADSEMQISGTVELIIAAVKGVRLLPDRAGAVLDSLEQLLIAPSRMTGPLTSTSSGPETGGEAPAAAMGQE